MTVRPGPHFHYVRRDGTGAAISLTESAWISPAEGRLSPEERSELAALLAGPAPSSFPGTVYQALLALWNDQNEGDGFHAPVDENAAMPDYSRLPGSVGLSNILDSELIRREPAEGSHGQVVGAAVMDGKLLGKVVE